MCCFAYDKLKFDDKHAFLLQNNDLEQKKQSEQANQLKKKKTSIRQRRPFCVNKFSCENLLFCLLQTKI